jgi:hypothetical protein
MPAATRDRKGGAIHAGDDLGAAMTGRGAHDDLTPVMTARKVVTACDDRKGTDIHDDLAREMSGREGVPEVT